MTIMLWLTVLLSLTPLCAMKPLDTDDVMTMLKSLQEKVENQEREIQLQRKAIDTQERKNHMQDQAIESLENVKEATVNTLFLATISADTIAISDQEPIIWDTAPINPGDHYSTVSGAYTAPYNGYYQFSVTKRSNDGRAQFWLLVDEERCAYFDTVISSGSAAPTGTATINIELMAGQTIKVENYISTVMYGTNSIGTIQSWFTGYMLYLL